MPELPQEGGQRNPFRTPSRSRACHWCGATRRRTPALPVQAGEARRAAVADYPRPRVATARNAEQEVTHIDRTVRSHRTRTPPRRSVGYRREGVRRCDRESIVSGAHAASACLRGGGPNDEGSLWPRADARKDLPLRRIRVLRDERWPDPR